MAVAGVIARLVVPKRRSRVARDALRPRHHRMATRSKSAFSGGASGCDPGAFNPGVPSANAVTSSRMLAQMIGSQKRSIGVNQQVSRPFRGNRWVGQVSQSIPATTPAQSW